MPGKLYLIPNSLGNSDPDTFLPKSCRSIIVSLKFLVVENIRNARRFLKTIDKSIDIDSITFFELNKHTDQKEIAGFLKPLETGHDLGIISEAGLPGIADPGAALVRIAHKKGLEVVPFTGPSSIFLSLMASGLNGQAFRFTGYLPVKPSERVKAIKILEKRAVQEKESQIFIETPYRNMALFEDILKVCESSTLLCIGVDLTMESELIKTASIASWKKKKPELNKRPAVFILGV